MHFIATDVSTNPDNSLMLIVEFVFVGKGSLSSTILNYECLE